MLGIVFLGLVFACVVVFAVFAFMFLSVAFEEPRSHVARNRPKQAGLLIEKPLATTGQAPTENQPPAGRAVATERVETPKHTQPVQAEANFQMSWKVLFSRDARHLRLLAFLVVMGGISAVFLSSQMVPASYGKTGPFREGALSDIEALPLRLHSDASCLKCHESVAEERADSPHIAVNCMHCHGLGHQHMIDAELAAKSPEHKIPPAEEWDEKFPSELDLFLTENRATCLSCHKSVVGMPEAFRSINVAEHLEEQGADEVKSANVCFECHTGHSPGL